MSDQESIAESEDSSEEEGCEEEGCEEEGSEEEGCEEEGSEEEGCEEEGSEEEGSEEEGSEEEGSEEESSEEDSSEEDSSEEEGHVVEEVEEVEEKDGQAGGELSQLGGSVSSLLSEGHGVELQQPVQQPEATGGKIHNAMMDVFNTGIKRFKLRFGRFRSSSAPTAEIFEYDSSMEYLGLEDRLKVELREEMEERLRDELREEMNEKRGKWKQGFAADWDEMERKIKDLEENNTDLLNSITEEIKLRSVVEERFLEKVEELRELEKEYRDLQAQNRELRTQIDQSGQANDVTLQQSSTAGSVEEPEGLCITLETAGSDVPKKVLTDCGHSSECRTHVATLSEERERLAEQNRELLAANAGLEERLSSLQHQLLEAENLRKDKAAMFQEIEDLQNKLTAERGILQKMKRQIMEQSRRMNVNFREHQAAVEQRDANIKQLEQGLLQLQQKVEDIEAANIKNQKTEDEGERIMNVRRTDITIKEVIDGGAWGNVSAGVYRGSEVAIKQPHQWIMHETTVDRMKREACNMARMHHPNLVTFIGGVFNDGKLPMILIEMMEANLRATYQRTNLAKDQIVSIFKDVAYALHYLHEFREPIIHRDLSAPNVLLKSLPGDRYVAKVSDFGSSNIAKLANTVAEGAIIYSAPESLPCPMGATSTPKQTVKMDTFSYGILLCEVINRKQPDPESRVAMVAAIAGEWRSMHSLVLRCVKDEAAQRPTMADILDYLRHK